MVDSLLKTGKGGQRSGSRGWGRLSRTIVLGSVAAAFALYWLAESYGADSEALLGYLETSLVFVLVFALAGAVLGGSLLALGALRRRRDRD